MDNVVWVFFYGGEAQGDTVSVAQARPLMPIAWKLKRIRNEIDLEGEYDESGLFDEG